MLADETARQTLTRVDSSSRRSTQLNVMAIGVCKEYLIRSIGTNAARQETHTARYQVLLPSDHVVDQQCKVIAAMLQYWRILLIANQVQLLVVADAKPCARKSKRRSRQRFEQQRIAIESDAAFHISNVNRDVI